MYKQALILAAIFTISHCEEKPYKTHHYVDPFALLDRHLSHSLTYLWPWSHLIRAAAALELEDTLEDPQIISDSEQYLVKLSVRNYKPDELKIKVKNRYMIVEGKHKVKNEDDKRYIANHFMQRFILPPGTRQDELKAVLNEKGILSISAPKHELPPPPPEREVPIEVIESETSTEKVDKETSPTPLELEVEATTHVGKIRKKELKTTTKIVKDNEVTKGGDGNGIDYALIEPEE
ncbi:heat shock protein beta-1-like [Pieris brassicae]|uniref:SHSP domain-containing protein n=1 Tax=Pieris brassicae TaxID=7116 RepID=A0A9P0SYL9_PIEBR|nr:heat shock protein beta-1-like [Pieris brassicae]CAH3953766.1 unnamed protein product [Pieris brassicae]